MRKKLSIIKKNKNKTKNQKEGIKHLNAIKLTVSWGKIIVWNYYLYIWERRRSKARTMYFDSVLLCCMLTRDISSIVYMYCHWKFRKTIFKALSILHVTIHIFRSRCNNEYGYDKMFRMNVCVSKCKIASTENKRYTLNLLWKNYAVLLYYNHVTTNHLVSI